MTDFDERWLQPGGIVEVDIPTTGALIREVQRLREWQAKANDRLAAAEKRANDQWAAACMERESAEHAREVALEQAAMVADREWVAENSLIGSKVARKIAYQIRDLKAAHPSHDATAGSPK